MNLGDITIIASNRLFENDDKRLLLTILKEAKTKPSVKKALSAFSTIPSTSVNSKELALHIVKENIEGIDAKEYRKFLKEMVGKVEPSDKEINISDRMNEAIHTAIVSRAGSSKYNTALDYIIENMGEKEGEEICEECNEEYEMLDEDDKKFLEGLSESDDEEKKLMFDDLKDRAISEADSDMDKAIEDGDLETVKEIKEAVVNIGKMKMNESNIIKLYEFAKKNK